MHVRMRKCNGCHISTLPHHSHFYIFCSYNAIYFLSFFYFFLPPSLLLCWQEGGAECVSQSSVILDYVWKCQNHACGHCFKSLDVLENLFLFLGNNIEKQSPEADFPETSGFKFLCSSALHVTVGSDTLNSEGKRLVWGQAQHSEHKASSTSPLFPHSFTWSCLEVQGQKLLGKEHFLQYVTLGHHHHPQWAQGLLGLTRLKPLDPLR